MSKMFVLDLRSLALFRIGLGALILWDIADRSRFLEDFWGPHGIYSLECAALNSTPLLSLYY